MERVKLTDNKKVIFDGIEFTQVELLVDIQEYKKGDLGGWVESIDNLKNPETGDIEGAILGEACIYNNAVIFDNAIVRDNATIHRDAMIFGNALVKGYVEVTYNGKVKDNAIIGARCRVEKDGVAANDIKIYTDITLNGETMTSSPPQMVGSKPEHPLALCNNMLSIGCETHTLTYWEQNIVSIGIEYEYTAEEIAEYQGYLKEAREIYGGQDVALVQFRR